MSGFKLLSHVATLSAVLGCTSLLAVSASAKTPELFSTLADTSIATLPQQAIAGKSRAVKINYGQLRSGRIALSLPGGISFEAVRDRQQDLGKGRLAWVGRASDDPDNKIVIAVSGNAVAGTFSYNGKLFKLEPRANGSHVLSEVSAIAPALEHDPIPVGGTTANAPNSTTTSTSTSTSTGGVAADTNGSVIDVLIAITPAVRALYGSEGDDALAIHAVAETNQAYINSNMTTRLNLVGVYLMNYIESGDMATDLNRLSGTNDGFMDSIHTVRDIYGADVVSLIEVGGQYCGIAYLMTTVSTGFAPAAFSVVHHSCATGYHTLAHEIGHNQGANHDLANSSGAQSYPYAHGYQNPDNAFRTVMAYNCVGGCTHIDHFANPDILYNGLPTGDASYAASAVAIDQTAPTVAAFREHVTDLPPGC
jgi:hypothetical protein